MWRKYCCRKLYYNNEIFDEYAPLTKKRLSRKPTLWLNIEIKQHINRRDKLLRKVWKSNSEHDWKSYKKLKTFCNNVLWKSKRNYYYGLLNENRLNPRRFWKSIKTIFLTKTKISTTSEGTKCSATSFAKFFSTAVTNLKRSCFFLTDLTWRLPKLYLPRTRRTFRFQYVSVCFVQKELKSLRRNKASGVDNLPPGLLKDSAKEIAVPLTHIINLSISTSTFPTNWKVARVTPIYKSGCTNDEANYRPISVLPILSRILEKAYTISWQSISRKTIFYHNGSLDVAQNDPPKRLQFCFFLISVKTLKKEN